MRVIQGKGAERFVKAGEKLCALYPEFSVLWYKVRQVSSRDDIPTCGIDANWKVFVNDAFFLGLPEEEALFVTAHEVFHPVLGHFERAQALGILDEKCRVLRQNDAKLWNIATDSCINNALTCLGLRLPQYACRTPTDYSGPLDAESLYAFLKKKHKDEDDSQSSQGMRSGGFEQVQAPGDGCGMMPVEEIEVGAEEHAKTQGQFAEAVRAVGKGTLYSALTANYRTQFPNWERLLKAAFSGLNAKHGYDASSYARPRRIGDGLLPRYKDVTPVLGIIVDTSGSLSRTQVASIIDKTIALARTYPNVHAALVTHTDKVNHAGWIDANTTAATLAKACSYTGGTEAAPAYAALKKLAGVCDWVIHFTDCYLESNTWPKVPGKRLLVGDFGGGHGTKPPAGAKVIQC